MLNGEGNMVAEYQEGKEKCELCNGGGELYFNNHDDLRFFFVTHNYSFGDTRKMVEQYNHEGVVKCPECLDGQIAWRR